MLSWLLSQKLGRAQITRLSLGFSAFRPMLARSVPGLEPLGSPYSAFAGLREQILSHL